MAEYCSTAECDAARAEGEQLVADTKTKHLAGELNAAGRNAFYLALEKNLLRNHEAVMHAYTPQEAAMAKQRAIECHGGAYNQCQMCDIVYKAGLALCAAYAATCPPCVAACIIITTLAYTRCIRTYCV